MLLFFCFHFLVLLDIAFMLIISLDSREQTLQMVSCERLALSPLLSYEEAAWAFFFFFASALTRLFLPDHLLRSEWGTIERREKTKEEIHAPVLHGFLRSC